MKRMGIVLLAAALLFGVAACGRPNLNDTPPVQTTGAVEENNNADEGARTVVDVWGREVVIKRTVERIVCLGSGAPRLAAYLGAMDMLAGVEDHDAKEMTVLRDYSPVYQSTMKDLPAVGAGGGSGGNNAYPEELIMLAPDVILAGFSAEAAAELQTQTGIPVVAVRYVSNGLANESFYSAMRVFAEVVNAQTRCESVLNYIDACKADLSERTAGVLNEQKLRAYTGAVTFSGKHGFTGTYSKFGPFDAIHAINVADEAAQEGYYETDFEKILAWDPDVIFLDPGNMHLVAEEYAGNPAYFAAVRAVREGNVYTMPSFNNCGMNMTYALMNAYYAGIVLFPEQFEDVNIEEISGDILTFFLGENTYSAMADGGLYYGKITIGA
ncbi:ABC transporter substrate-binding protein [Christensenellaceae bacterium OttesenSCG-928-L17]|nr:ABC transporter substrate-binding protein [Christensenellaceae bacterium OttesenSCG-928-L17]